MNKFTIAIPVYNGMKYILNAINSAVNQKYEDDYEILVVDNCSKDGTSELIQKCHSKIRVVKNKKTISMYENHNKCLENAKGDYVLFCHSDDVLTENALAILDKHISSHDFPPKFVIWGRSMFRDFGANYQINGGEINKILSGMNSVKPFLYGGLTPSGTCYSRKSLFNLGGFIKCNHPLSPSDMTTMLMLALDGFEFKMIDRLLFKRTFASTMIEGAEFKDVMDSVVDAVLELESVVSMNKIKQLIDVAQSSVIQPFLFYYACIKNDIFKNRIRKIVFRKCVKKPILFRHKIVWRILL